MRVALLNTKDTPRSDYILSSFADGLFAFGDRPVWVRDRRDAEALAEADVGVQVCFPNRHHDGNDLAVFRLEAYERLARLGKRVLTFDTGYVRSQPEMELIVRSNAPAAFHVNRPETYPSADASIYYAAGFDGIKRNADYGSPDVGPDRWDKLKTRVYPWRKAGNHIVLIGQPLHGQSSQHADIRKWYAETVRLIRTASQRPIVYRPHPRIATFRTNEQRRRRDEVGVRNAVGPVRGFSYSKNRLLREDLGNAWAVVAFTSNAVVESVVRGVPVFACDPACMAWDVAGHKLKFVEKPTMADRQPWLNRLAYAQWNCAEMRSGECWKHLRPHAVRGKT